MVHVRTCVMHGKHDANINAAEHDSVFYNVRFPRLSIFNEINSFLI